MEQGNVLRAEIFPYQSFKEKLQLTKKLYGKGRVEILDNYVYVQYYNTTSLKS